MSVLPSAIVFFNNDLSDKVKARIIRQLHISDVLDGYEFDANVAADSTYPDTVRLQGRRMMVIRSFEELTNREHADVVLFVKAGLAAVLTSKYGPPGSTHRVLDLYWGKLGIL